MKIIVFAISFLAFALQVDNIYAQTQAEIKAMLETVDKKSEKKAEKKQKTKKEDIEPNKKTSQKASKESETKAKAEAKENQNVKSTKEELQSSQKKVKETVEDKATKAKAEAKENQKVKSTKEELQSSKKKLEEAADVKTNQEKAEAEENLNRKAAQTNESKTQAINAKYGLKKLAKFGDKSFEEGSFFDAKKYYTEALQKAKKDKHKVCLNQKLGVLSDNLRDYSQSEKYFTRAIEENQKPKKFPLLEYQLANSLKYQAKYENALTAFAEFNKLQADNDKVSAEKKRARIEKKGAILGRDMSSSQDMYTLEVLDNKVNGNLAEYGPELVKNSLYYTKIQENDAFSKIYYSEISDDKFDLFQDFAPSLHQNNIHIGNPSFSQDRKSVYFTKCKWEKTEYVDCIIMKSTKEENIWQEPIALEAPINLPNTSNSQPQIAYKANGDAFLLFTSNRSGSKGGKDIWKSEISEKGSFEKVRRLSSPINTAYDDIAPFYHSASNTLYFSSNGHPSIGGFDIFKVENYIDNEDDYLVQNAGMPINSSLDDYDFVLNDREDLGFLVSNRGDQNNLQNKTCCDDIYMLKSTVVDLFVKGKVYAENEHTREVYTEADVFLIDLENNKMKENVIYTQENGFVAKIEKDKKYKLRVISDDFEEEFITFNTLNMDKSDTIQYDIFLKERDLTGYNIATINYVFNQSKLNEQAPDTLKRVINFMKNYPEVVVEVGSHTDAKGSEEYNLKLSERRSISVKNYLINIGKIQEKRLINKAYGESKPIAPNKNEDQSDNPEGREKNRRTEFKIIEKEHCH